MKKLMIIVSAIAMVLAGQNATFAQSKLLQKELKKEYKAKIKEYKKGGWKLAGSSRSLEVALLRHYEKLNDPSNNELVGEVSGGKSFNLMSQAAINNACAKYAALAGSTLKGRIVSDSFFDQSSVDGSEEFDRMYAAYERLVDKELKGEITESYSIYREKKDGMKEYKTFFLVNEDAASKARVRAFENAAKESAAAQKYAEKVSDFVRAGFEVK